MKVLKRFFSIGKNADHDFMDRTLDYQPYTIYFSGGRTATAVTVPQTFDPGRVTRLLKLPVPSPTIFISGGAGGMSEEDTAMTRRVVEEGLIPFAQQRKLVIIDGGTQTGVMQLTGDARCRNDYQFPLIGIAPIGLLEFPGHPNPGKQATLNDGHSHFVFVEGNEWGNESHMILQLTNTLTGGGQKPALVIIINGGKIVQQEAYMATSKEMNLPLLVLQGSGRFADELAEAKTSGRTDVSLVKSILKYGNIQVVGTSEGPEGMKAKLQQIFGA